MARQPLPVSVANTEEIKVRLPPPVAEALAEESLKTGVPRAVLLRMWAMQELNRRLVQEQAA